MPSIVTDLYRYSLELIGRAQAPTGAIVAALNYKTYDYSWLRDGSFAAYALDVAGEHAAAAAFYRWAGRVVATQREKVDRLVAATADGGIDFNPDDPAVVLPTRYRVDGEVDKTPWGNFQLDGYGTWLWGLAEHVRRSGDELIPRERAIQDAVEVTVEYLLSLWRLPNYDCWEEQHHKVHVSTLAAIWGGLRAANGWLKRNDIERALNEIREFVTAHGVADGHLVKFIGTRAVDASLLWAAAPFGLFGVDDLIMRATADEIDKKLRVGGGGVHRYADDTYYGGGEWTILTCWLGWYRALRGERDEALRLLAWVEAQADENGHLPEQVPQNLNAPSYLPYWEERWGRSARPLVWSHAMYVVLHDVLSRVDGRREGGATGHAQPAAGGERGNVGAAGAGRRLVHLPFGIDDRYTALPEERSPRDPVAGQVVRVRATTWPANGEGPAVMVLSWKRDGADQKPVEARHVVEPEGASFWEAEFGPFSAGEVISYRFEAGGDGWEGVGSEEFSFVVAGNWYLNSVKDIVVTGDSALVRCEATVDIAAGRDDALGTFGAFGVAGQAKSVPAVIRLDFARPKVLGIEVRLDDLGREAEKGNGGLRVRDNGASMTVGSSGFEATVNKENCALAVKDASGKTLLESYDVGNGMFPFHFQFRETASRTGGAGEGAGLWRAGGNFRISPSEALYGFGERFNALNQRGHDVDIWVYNQYLDQGERTYLPVPFYMSSVPYGFELQQKLPARFEIGTRLADLLTVRVEGDAGRPSLAFALIQGGDYAEILTRRAERSGLPELPPAWAFGPWMSSNAWDREEAIRTQIALTTEHQIPATVVVLEAWSDESTFYIFNDAQYEPAPGSGKPSYGDFRFPEWGRWRDPRQMVADFHKLGMRVILWQIPVLKQLADGWTCAQHENDTTHAVASGFVAVTESAPYRIPFNWFNGSLLVDFSNPEATEWWLSKRGYLLDEVGVDGFKTDGGEFVWGRNTRFHGGRTALERHNEYPDLYVGALHRFAGKERVTFSRAGFADAHKYPLHWAGDERSTWDAFWHSIVAGLTAGMSGIPFWGWDLAGFSGEIPSAELYLRSAAVACFCPVMQYHAESKGEHCLDRTPWNIQERTSDERVIPTYRFFANLRMNLQPFIAAQAALSSRTGAPLMRAMAFAFPDDPHVRDMTTQYLFGTDLLVRPVTEPGATEVEVYLPAGWWYDFRNHEVFEGPRLVRRAAPIDWLPVFVRAGAVLPLNLGKEFSLGSWVGNDPGEVLNLTLVVYPEHVWQSRPADGCPETDIRAILAAAGVDMDEAARDGNKAETVTFAFAGMRAGAVEVDGRPLPLTQLDELETAGEGWSFSDDLDALLVKIPILGTGSGGSNVIRLKPE